MGRLKYRRNVVGRLTGMGGGRPTRTREVVTITDGGVEGNMFFNVKRRRVLYGRRRNNGV